MDNQSSPPLLPLSDGAEEQQDKESFREVEHEASPLPPPMTKEEQLGGIENMSPSLKTDPPIPLSERENEIICAEEQNRDPFSVCIEVEDVEVEDEQSPLPSQVIEPLPFFPLSEINNGEAVLEEDMWPSLPPPSSMQGMLPLPCLPLSEPKSGGWIKLFANNENSTVVGLSQRRSTIKRMQSSPPLPLIPIKQHSRDCTVLPQLLSPPPLQIEEVEEISSRPLYLAKQRNTINEQKSKKGVQETFQNPFALLADMEKEKEEDTLLPSPPQGACEKRRISKCFHGVDQNQRTRMASRKKITKSSLFFVFVITLLCIFPFGK